MKMTWRGSFLLAILIATAGVAHAQEKAPLDCSKNLDPHTPYMELLIGCPKMANTPNNVAAQAIKPIGDPPPTVKQCQADLAAWKQADDDWLAKEKTLISNGALPINANPRPDTLLSVEELYRRSREANLCVLYLGEEKERVRSESKQKPMAQVQKVLWALEDEQNDLRNKRTDFLVEQLSRAESVIDKHLLWDDLRATKN
jgi:hypothetical protein